MATFTSQARFANHPVHATLKTFLGTIVANQPAHAKKIGKNDAARSAYLRIRFVLRHCMQKLAQTHPLLAPKGQLDALNSAITSANGAWNNYASNPHPNHIEQLESSADSILAQATFFPFHGGAPSADAYRELVEAFQSDTESAFSKSEAYVASIDKRAQEISTALGQSNQKIASFETEITNQKSRLDTLVTTQTTAFTTSQNERDAKIKAIGDEFNKSLKAWESAATEQRNVTGADLAKFKKDAEDKKNALIVEIEKALTHAQKTLHAVIGTSMTGNYQNIARREWWSAVIMRALAVLFFGGMVGALIWMVCELTGGIHGDAKVSSVDWTAAAFRFGLGLALLVPGVYCAKESAMHWRNETRHRRLALELASIEPYLTQLSNPAQREEVYKAKVKDYFVGHSDQLDGEGHETPQHLERHLAHFFKVLDRVADVAAKLRK